MKEFGTTKHILNERICRVNHANLRFKKILGVFENNEACNESDGCTF